MNYKEILYLLAASLLLVGCSGSKSRHLEEVPDRSVYFWKTTFDLTEAETRFLTEHNIKRIYMRMYDVDLGTDYDWKEKPLPKGTIKFKSTVPDGIEVVPVIYLENRIFWYEKLPKFEELMLKRVKNMFGANNLGAIREVQIDCDWSESTQKDFFAFCSRFADLLHEEKISLSATIRLHQLRLPAPPVDRGVLMLYNMGSLYDFSDSNSILDPKETALYLKNEVTYGIPLSLALPTFSWAVLFNDELKFRSLVSREAFDAHIDRYEKIGWNKYRIENDYIDFGNRYGSPGCILRLESSAYRDIMKVKQMALEKIVSPIGGVIIYHLDEKNLREYSNRQIENVFE